MATLTRKPKSFTLERNTAKRVVKDVNVDRIEVEIGDSKSDDFKPQFKFMRWNNEVNFSMRAAEHADATTTVSDGVIKYKTPEYEVHQYEKPDVGEDGGYEFEWVLLKKPVSNTLTATIETKGLNFYYQRALTQQEKDSGKQQPDSVIGSYAVYHKTKRDNHIGGTNIKQVKHFIFIGQRL